MAIVCFEFIPL